MTRTDDGSAWVPLLPWATAFCALLIATVAFLLSAWAGTVPASQEFVEFNKRRISAFADSLSDDPYVVVLLGDSRLKYATDDEQALAARISASIGRPARVLRIVNNLAVFDDFAPLTPPIRRLKPDLLILQNDLVQTGRPLRMSADLLRLSLLDGFLPGIPSLVEDDVHTVQFEHPCWEATRSAGAAGRSAASRRGVSTLAMQVRLEETRRWVQVRPDGPTATAAREFTVALRREGTEVALVSTPPAPAYQSFLRSADSQSGATQQTARPPLAAVQHWSPPAQHAGMYCDLTHLSPAGSRSFSDWLIDRVAGVAQRQRGAGTGAGDRDRLAARAGHRSQNGARPLARSDRIL